MWENINYLFILLTSESERIATEAASGYGRTKLPHKDLAPAHLLGPDQGWGLKRQRKK